MSAVYGQSEQTVEWAQTYDVVEAWSRVRPMLRPVERVRVLRRVRSALTVEDLGLGEGAARRRDRPRPPRPRASG